LSGDEGLPKVSKPETDKKTPKKRASENLAEIMAIEVKEKYLKLCDLLEI